MPKKRILLITRNLPPLVGGMERLNWHMADELSKHSELRVIGPKGAAALKPDNVVVTEAPLKPLTLFLLVAFLKSLWQILRWKPDVVLAGSGLTAPLAWLGSKMCGARSAAYLHGFDITVQNRLYQRLWSPTFKKLDVVVVNSTPTKNLARAAGVPEARISIVHPGVSIPDAPQPEEALAAFKQQHGLQGKKILLSVGRLTTRKGLCEFVEHALPKIVELAPSAMLVVIGEAPKNALGAGIQSVESILEQAKKSGVAEHLCLLGVITDRTMLATAYEAADVHVFPVRHIPDDPEGFGMVAIEAAAHGLPTVAYSTGGIVDAVAEGQSGYLVPPGDYPALAEGAVRLLTDSSSILRTSSRNFAAQFAWPILGAKIRQALRI